MDSLNKLPRRIAMPLDPADPTVQVSVIMAVHNSQATIERALDSILTQQIQGLEVVAIDDGSTDSSADILARYATRDSRLKFYSQPNAGVAATRARGTSLAKGTYLLHVDPDDFLEPNAIATLVKQATATDADITVCNFSYDRQKGHTTVTSSVKSQYFPDATSSQLVDLLVSGKFHGSLCNKLIRRDAYARTGAGFFAGINVGEDMLVVLQLLLGGAKPTFVDRALYHYTILGSGTLTSSYTRDSYLNRMLFISTAARLIEQAGARFYTPATKEAVNGFMFRIKTWGTIAGVVSRQEFYATPHLNRFRYLKAIEGGRRYRVAIIAALLGLWPLSQRLIRLAKP